MIRRIKVFDEKSSEGGGLFHRPRHQLRVSRWKRGESVQWNSEIIVARMLVLVDIYPKWNSPQDDESTRSWQSTSTSPIQS
jgi:hypothetical protein